MSTTLLTAALVGAALLHGAEPQAEPKKEETTASEAPAATEQGQPAAETQGEPDRTKKEETPAETKAEPPASSEVDRPTHGGDRTSKRVGAFWFISIGK